MKLPPGEAERRRKARVAHSFSNDAYKHYDVRREGYGSVDQWVSIAEALLNGKVLSVKPTTGMAADLSIFGLDTLPADAQGLKKAFRNACFVYHPDHGGTEDAFKKMYAAYERLAKQYA